MKKKMLNRNKKGQAGWFIFAIVAVIVIVIVLLMGFDNVPAGHVGVKDKFGVVTDEQWGPGYAWTGLFTNTQLFDTRIQLKEYDVNAFSSDAQIVKTQVALNFRIDPNKAPEIYKNIGINYQEIIIAPVVQEIVKANTAKYELSELVNKRGEVKNAITMALIDKLSGKGLIVTEVALTNFEFSSEVQAAIENKQVAEQNALAAENKLEEMRFTSEAMQLQTKVIEIKKLDLELERIKKWNGQLPKFVIYGSDSDSNPMLMNIDMNSI